jgi:hypothetical protein
MNVNQVAPGRIEKRVNELVNGLQRMTRGTYLLARQGEGCKEEALLAAKLAKELAVLFGQAKLEVEVMS